MTFVVAGTGRCGTTWLSDVLTSAGVPVGHEDVWTVSGRVERPDLAGDVSMYAAPFLDRWDGPVLHMVRHPLACIGSLVGWELPSEPNAQGDGGKFVWEHLGFTSSGDRVTDSARYWCDWNEMCERGSPNLRFHVEDIDAVWLSSTMRWLGWSAPVADVKRAMLKHRPLDYRASAHRAPLRLEWSDIREPELGRVRRLAERYGYDA